MPLQDLFYLQSWMESILQESLILKSMKIKNTAPLTGNLAICATPVIFSTTILIGTFNTKVINIPNTPLINPIRNVSALNTRVISFLLAPIERKIPISFVRSNTENIRNYTNHDA